MIRIFLVLLLLPMFASAQPLTPAGRIVLKSDLEGFGGLSGIEVFTDGHFLAITDKGRFIEGNITRIDGEIRKVTFSAPRMLLDSKGIPLTAYHTNAEGQPPHHAARNSYRRSTVFAQAS